MTYLEFLIIFVGVPIVCFFFFALKRKSLDKKTRTGILLMGIIALVYTTPWDNYLIMRGVWNYPLGVVIGTIGFVPIEEYGFMVLQTILAGILWSLIAKKENSPGLGFSPTGIVLALGIGLYGAYCLRSDSGTYLGLILVWAAPPLALQWGLGAVVLKESMSSWLPIWIGLTFYLCLADAFAISEGIWSLALSTRTGFEFGNLPIEEALFFAVTNLFVIQGLCLWQSWRRERV